MADGGCCSAVADPIPSRPLIPSKRPSAMRIRTCLLAAFGLVVPLIAMFSHLIPSGVADSLWQLAWQPAAAFFDDASSQASTTAGAPQADPAVAADQALPRDTAATLLPDDATVAAMPMPGFATGGLSSGLNAGPPETGLVLPTVDLSSDAAAAFPSPQPESRPTATVRRPPGEVEPPLWSADAAHPAATVTPTAMTESPTSPDAVSPDAIDPAMAATLEQLGAFAITCQPTIQGRYFHCSCRVAADPTGQLVRMFHATEPDKDRALLRLIDDVRRWKAQIAVAPAGVPAASDAPRFSREAN